MINIIILSMYIVLSTIAIISIYCDLIHLKYVKKADIIKEVNRLWKA